MTAVWKTTHCSGDEWVWSWREERKKWGNVAVVVLIWRPRPLWGGTMTNSAVMEKHLNWDEKSWALLCSGEGASQMHAHARSSSRLRLHLSKSLLMWVWEKEKLWLAWADVSCHLLICIYEYLDPEYRTIFSMEIIPSYIRVNTVILHIEASFIQLFQSRGLQLLG